VIELSKTSKRVSDQRKRKEILKTDSLLETKKKKKKALEIA